ncbi:hypothetical protein [Streptomyces sp. NPDC102437]|uniref:hypothetical protein n=1 Tax=Streptomyces sp. NPDC102437 TaxID=3366175 RepID=UPI00382E0600
MRHGPGPETPGDRGGDAPVPRDMPDEQRDGEDALDVPVPRRVDERRGDGGADEVPPSDESAANRAEERQGDHPGLPAPDESPD